MTTSGDTHEPDDDDDAARRERAERLRREIEDLRRGRGPGPPSSPRGFTDEKAREAAEDARAGPAGDDR